MHQAEQERDMAALQRGAVRIENQLWQILQQLDQDTHTIQYIAERAKAADEQMPCPGVIVKSWRLMVVMCSQ